MKDSMVVNFAYHANDPNIGLSLHSDSDQYKMFVGDTGLFVTLSFWDKDITENVIYEKLLSGWHITMVEMEPFCHKLIFMFRIN